jgi:hypothetical protein
MPCLLNSCKAVHFSLFIQIHVKGYKANTLNKTEDKESFVDAENGMYMFLNNILRMNVTNVGF